MPKFEYAAGDGNDGFSRMFPDGELEAETLGEAFALVLADYAGQCGEPDYTDGDEDELQAVWDELEGAPALNGGAALIVVVWEAE